MKITKNQLAQIIREEIQSLTQEYYLGGDAGEDDKDKKDKDDDDDEPDDDQGEGDELNMSARFAKKGKRNFGKQKE